MKVRAARVLARRPSAHWGLLAVLLLCLIAALTLDGLTRGGGTGTRALRGSPAPLPGSVVYQGSEGIGARGLPDRTAALTFDDGPDPRWTPQVLDVLKREQVHATFFVTGEAASRHPELVRRMLAEGHEIGLHTWTHSELASLPAWRARLELSLTQLAVARATGHTTALMRPPYSSTPDAVSTEDRRVLRRASDDGYVVVLSDRDGQDWRRPGVAEIVRTAGPDGGRGAVVLLHDGGGDRAQTVAALPGVIAAYRTEGFALSTVSSGLGLAPTAAVRPAGRFMVAEGHAIVTAAHLSRWLPGSVNLLVLPLAALMLLRTVLVLGLAGRHVRVSTRRVGTGDWAPPVSVVVPAYNEAVGIEASIRSLAASTYAGELEIVVVDDGSTDGTADLVESLALPGVLVVRRVNGGKAAALATGIEQTSHELLVLLDGDTVFEPETIRWVVQPLRDPKVGAVSGNIKVGNRHGLLGRWQHLEYVMGFNLDRRVQDLFGFIATVPGACGAFRREALDAVGGMSLDTLAEDTDITMAISRAGYQVVYEERARAWTEAPLTMRDLWRQRYRWAYGTLQCVWKHRGAMRERSTLGLIGIPYVLTVQVLVALLSPVVDIFAAYGLLFGDAQQVLLVWGGFQLLGIVSAGYALRLDGESLRPLWVLPLQQFVYRQLMYLVIIQSVVAALAGLHLPWHKLERTGLDAEVLGSPAEIAVAHPR